MEDLNEKIREINIMYAIRDNITSSLHKILEKLQRGDLYMIAGNSGIEDYNPKNRKAKNKLEKLILNKKSIREKLLIASRKEYNLFLELLDKKYLIEYFMPLDRYNYLVENGLLYVFYYKKSLYFLIPDEIKSAYKKMNQKKLEEEIKRYQLVTDYIDALSDLYGAVKQSKLIEIFNSQNDKNLTRSEFIKIFNKIMRRQQIFDKYGDYIVSDYFDSENIEELEKLIEKSKGKPYYIPDKDKLLKYSDNIYYEMTPQLIALKEYVLKNMCKNEELVEYLIDDIDMHCSMEDKLQDIIFEFERRNIVFSGMKQFKEILPLIIDVYNNSRLWANRGHTPSEINNITGESLPNIISEKIRIPVINKREVKNKIGRNDPCPCGSGKKYKKCCGR